MKKRTKVSYFVDYTQSRRCTELGPISGTRQPLETLAQEFVACCTSVHKRISKRHC